MSQIRFNVGVPRGGSAARLSEESGEAPYPSLRPEAGSAARAAEERKRSEGGATQRSVTIGLRATGARTMADASPAQAPAAVPAQPTSSAPPRVHIERRTGEPGQTISAGNRDAVAPLSADTGVEDSVSSQAPPSAAARIKSLVRSLFGGSSGKS